MSGRVSERWGGASTALGGESVRRIRAGKRGAAFVAARRPPRPRQ